MRKMGNSALRIWKQEFIAMIFLPNISIDSGIIISINLSHYVFRQSIELMPNRIYYYKNGNVSWASYYYRGQYHTYPSTQI